MADIAPSTAHSTSKSKKSNDSNHSGDEKAKKKLATLSELFSFSTTEKRTRPFLILGLTSASVTGCVYPAMAFFFAQVFEEFSADVSDGDSFMDGIRRMAYTFMVLGVIAYIFMSIQNTLLDSAATDMANTFQKTYLSLLLHQDPTYFDLTDVAGAAGMISQNGAKFKKGVGRKLGEGIQFGVTMLGGFIYAFYASWMVSLVILTILPVMALSAMFLMNMIANQSSASSKGYQRAGEIAYAAVSGIRTILSLNAVGVTIDKYKGATKEACDSATKREWKLGLANGAVMGSMLLGYVVITLFGMWVLYDEVTKNGCDPSNAVPTNEPCSTTGMDVFGSLMGISFAAMGLPQISAMLEALTAAREAAYPLFVLKRRCDGDYNDDFDIEALLDDTTIGGTKVSDLNISESGKDEGNEDDKKLDQMETTHHKKRIPPSKMPPYLIDASSSSGIKPDTCNGSIEFCNVTFSYPSRRQVKVLDGLSLSIESGKTVAIVGHSGCGKSSIMQLIERFYDVDSDGDGDGEDVEKGNRNCGIKLDGVDLRDLNVKWLRSQIGLVSQEPKLFAKTIRENIAMGVWGSTSGVEPPTQEEIEEAAKLANAHDFITQFPSGYDTFVGDSGAQLSGGQKQRIAIARVLLRRPKILLLDEATSALDSESERTVQNALDNLLSKDTSSGQSKMTTIVVAHRLSTIRNADLIAVADKGKIVEKGTHEELMVKEDGAYRALVEAQTGRPSNLHNATSNKKNEEKEDDRKDTKDDDRRTSVFVPSTKKSLTEQGNELILKDVRFHYPTRKTKEIFNGLNLAVKRGETLALVGPSGQGKSTIIQLIERYYDPTHGTIEFEGRDLKSLNIGYYREQIGLVSQEPTLFNDTIAANIKYGKPDASDEEMYEAARMANCHSFITSFPDGYNTNLGETALAVSGGQKQRIAIARAIIKRPRILLLDEATSALDTGSEKIVQEALDKITSSSSVTSIVIAHRLSTVRNADRIAYISDGKVRETGTHDELMANPDSKYRKLHEMQNMGIEYKDEADDDGNAASDIKHHHHHRHHKHHHKQHNHKKHHHKDDSTKLPEDKEVEESVDNLENTKEKQKEKKNASKARVLAREDWKLFGIGSVGAVLAGLMFPGWGIVFAYMIEFLYYPVFPCDEDAGIMPPPPYTTCIQYWDFVADDMQGMSITLTFGWLGIIGATCIGNILIFYGFGTASEKMNKRVRDAAFTSLLRQEIAFFDCRTVGSLTSQLQDDAAMIHSFSGEPLRQLIMSLASVLVGVVVSFIFMWPFALVSLGTIPFMGFGAEMEMKMYMGEDHGDHSKEEEDGPGAIAIESLLNIRTVASLSLESNRLDDYEKALTKGNEDIVKSSFKKGSLVAIGQFIQMWGCALMFWWGGWLLSKYPSTFTYRDFLISMFSLLFSLSGLGMAAQGATNRDKAKEAADRIFDLMERESAIDPLSNEGYKEE